MLECPGTSVRHVVSRYQTFMTNISHGSTLIGTLVSHVLCFVLVVTT